MRASILTAVFTFVGCLNLGCYHEDWTFRVARDVQVLAVDGSLRPGALTLVPADEARIIAAASTDGQPAALTDAMLREKLTARSEAQLEMRKLSSTLTPSHPTVVKQKAVLDAIDADIARLTQQASTHHMSAASASKPKTVLIIAQEHVGPPPIPTHLGGEVYDRYNWVLVLMLDQPLAKETIWATPENSMLISYNPYTPPQRNYGGAEGSVKIVSVNGNEVVADIAMRQHNDVDDADAYYFRLPWELHGRRSFTVATAQDPLFKGGALRYGAPKAAPATQPLTAWGRSE